LIEKLLRRVVISMDRQILRDAPPGNGIVSDEIVIVDGTVVSSQIKTRIPHAT
jgi:hypothetical protein